MPTTIDPGAPRIALVLAGGAARGAYEVGVVQHLLEDVARDIGRDVPIDVLCGTSVGALNACVLAAFADEPRGRAARLAKVWTDLSVNALLRVDTRGVLTMAQRLLGRPPAGPTERPRALVDPSGLERLVRAAIPFERIPEHLARGRLAALTVSTTHVASGRTIVFVERPGLDLPPWTTDPSVVPRAARVGVSHAMASAAIPILFPAVNIDGDYFCDGGLRQNVPLSPARRLGADGVIVVSPRHLPQAAAPPPGGTAGAPGAAPSTMPAPGPLFLLGKALNALLLDRIDNDLSRLTTINRILEAGERRYGPTFGDALNEELGYAPGRGLRPMQVLLVRTSRDIGELSAAYVRSPRFRARVRGPLGYVMQRLAEGEARSEADLLSYLLFDGEFARMLIALGREDARARHDELCAFFDAFGAARSAPRRDS